MFAGALGKALVFAAIACFLVSAAAWIRRAPRVGAIAFWTGAGIVVATFAVHVSLLMGKQFQYQYVWANTQLEMPAVYRFSSAWAAQEGSFLLWVLTSSVFAAIVATRTGIHRRWFTVVCSFALIAMLGITAYESPFKLIEITGEDLSLLAPGQTMVLPPTGLGLNPTLQNYWMAIHPWVIFIGFGSLLSLFAWAWAAALGRDREVWVAGIRPWAIFSMTMLGLGLTMGGLWAYETLGWGGFWAWDPVENVSLVPFIGAAALVHGLYIQSMRGAWQNLNVLLAALPFFWFAYGTYLTRSGALVGVSVHSFARMNEGAHGLLLGLVLLTTLSVVAVAILAFRRKPPNPPKPSGQRLFGLGLGMAFLYSIGVMAAIGMSVPFFAAMFGGTQEIVEEGIYNKVVAWPFVPTMIAMAIVPFLGWTKTRAERWQQISNVFFVTVLVFGLVVFGLVRSGLTMDGDELMPRGQLILLFSLVWICLFSIAGNGARLYERLRARAGGVAQFITHVGIAVMLLGLVVSKAFEKTAFGAIGVTTPARLEAGPANLLANLEHQPTVTELLTPEAKMHVGLIDLRSQNAPKIDARPTLYFHTGLDPNQRPEPVIRPWIRSKPLYDLYLVAGTPEASFARDIVLEPGEERTIEGVTLRYIEPTIEGEAGEPGAKFGAKVEVTYGGATVEAHPVIELGPDMRIINHDARVGSEFTVGLDALQAGSQAATFSLRYPEPLFPVQLFFKPLTILVWIGTGLMTFGGFLAVAARSRRREPTDPDNATDKTPEIEDTSRSRDLCEPGLRR